MSEENLDKYFANFSESDWLRPIVVDSRSNIEMMIFMKLTLTSGAWRSGGIL